MIYISLVQPIRGFDKVRIKEFHFYEAEPSRPNPFFVISYQIIKVENNSQITELYNKVIQLNDINLIVQLSTAKSEGNLSCFDTICKMILTYMVSQSIENGTIEVM